MKTEKTPLETLQYHVTGAIESGQAQAIVCIPAAPKCDMVAGCQHAVSHIDDGGFIYCERHGKQRQQYRRCRKLRPAELKRVLSGQPVSRF